MNKIGAIAAGNSYIIMEKGYIIHTFLKLHNVSAATRQDHLHATNHRPGILTLFIYRVTRKDINATRPKAPRFRRRLTI